MNYFDGLNARNTKIKLRSLGQTEFKYVSAGDSIKFSEIISEKTDDKATVKQILFNQLLTPKISFEAFSKIPNSELEQLVKAFTTNETHTFKYLSSNGDIYFNFVEAIKKYHSEYTKEIQKIFQPALSSMQKAFDSIGKQHAAIFSTSTAISNALEQVQKNADVYIRLAESARQTTEQYRSLITSIQKTVVPQVTAWNKWFSENNGIFKKLNEAWSDFQSKYNIAEPQAAAVLRKYKWFLSPGIPINLIFAVQQIDKKKGRQDKAVNSIFINFFENNDWENLEALVDSWKKNPLFQSRYKIIEDCVKLVKAGSKEGVNVTNAILPTLIVQIDGIVNDYMKIKGLAFNGYNDRNKVIKANKPATLNSTLEDLANEIFLDILFQKSVTGKPLANPYYFNRHKILHAENTAYGKKNYLIRAFMVLDLLNSLK